jgi:aryl-alcohol dehydrogenase-like predicted oxidoreductase
MEKSSPGLAAWAERDIDPLEVMPGIGFVPYSPLGKGFLTGAMNENTKLPENDCRSIPPRFTPQSLEGEPRASGSPRADREREKATPAQIALAWLLAQKYPEGALIPRRARVDVAPLPGRHEASDWSAGG